jgi:NIPSNAP
MKARFWKSKWWGACGIGLLSFAAGSLLTAVFAGAVPVRADSNRIFELRVYHDLPGKLPVMEARFREKTSKILARHNLDVVGYWVTTDVSASENSFIFMLAHESQEEAKKNWEAMFADPEFKEIEKAEQSEKTLEKAEVTYMRPTDFSSMK